jgi:hypothetical protein
MAYKDLAKKRANQKKLNAKNYANRTPAQKEKDLERAREYRIKNRDKILEGRRASVLKYRYQMTIEDFDNFLKSQNYCCAICKSEKHGNNKNWHIDHCHSTGKVRGVLCTNCNIMLGNAKDNELILAEAVRYLHKSRGAG